MAYPIYNQGEYDQPPELQDVSRQRKFAEILRQQSLQDPQGQMVSGHYVAPSITQNLARLLQGYTAGKINENADKSVKNYQTDKAAALAAILSGNKPAPVGTPVQNMKIPAYEPNQQDQFGSPIPGIQRTPVPDGAPIQQTESPEQVAQRQQAATLGYLQKYPNDPAAQYLLARNDKLDDRNFNVQQEAATHARDRGERIADIKDQQEFQRILAKDQQGFQLTQQEKQFAQQFALQQNSQGFQSEQNRLNREQQERLYGTNSAPVAIVGADGKPTYVTRKDAIGQQPYKQSAPGFDENGFSTKPIPASSLKLQNEALESLATAKNIDADLGGILNQMNSGKLNLGAMNKAGAFVRSNLNMSNENDRNIGSFNSTLEKLRNDSLRLNKGVQTEGDAQRAWDELMSNTNDQALVKQQIERIRKINERAANLQKSNIDVLRNNYQAPPLDYSKYDSPKPAVGTSTSGWSITPVNQ